MSNGSSEIMNMKSENDKIRKDRNDEVRGIRYDEKETRK